MRGKTGPLKDKFFETNKLARPKLLKLTESIAKQIPLKNRNFIAPRTERFRRKFFGDGSVEVDYCRIKTKNYVQRRRSKHFCFVLLHIAYAERNSDFYVFD